MRMDNDGHMFFRAKLCCGGQTRTTERVQEKNGDNNDRRIHQQLTKGVPQQKTTTLEVGETRVSTW